MSQLDVEAIRCRSGLELVERVGGDVVFARGVRAGTADGGGARRGSEDAGGDGV